VVEFTINGEIKEVVRCRGSYVWACYAVGISVIIYNVLSPIVRKKKLLKQEARRRLSEAL
jgi:heme exporter protein CcmD